MKKKLELQKKYFKKFNRTGQRFQGTINSSTYNKMVNHNGTM